MTDLIHHRGFDFELPLSFRLLAKHQDAVNELIDELKELQSNWNNLSLLGELAQIGTEISDTRKQFQVLSKKLCTSLLSQSVQDAAQQLQARAQNAIDILIRNLYERTADIGFFATDPVLVDYFEKRTHTCWSEAEQTALRTRMSDYVAKYSVYRNIVLLDPQGQVLLDLTDEYAPCAKASWIPRGVNAARVRYLEGHRGLEDKQTQGDDLIYAWKVESGHRTVGHVALIFNLREESELLFSKVLGFASGGQPQNWTVCGVLDQEQRVLVSSDPDHLRMGQKIRLDDQSGWQVIQIGPTAYLACSKHTRGYQGYEGPGWTGFAMIPIDQALNLLTTQRADVSLQGLTFAPGMVNPDTWVYQQDAHRIQLQLNRSVWNGNIAQKDKNQTFGASFSKSLLWEISRAGERTKALFQKTLDDLLIRSIGGKKTQQESYAMLATDLMDRNLYERANDCRWWAQNPVLLSALERPNCPQSIANARECLKYIQSLYTVYTDILVLDERGTVLCNSHEQDRSGTRLECTWLRKALAMNDALSYAVSDFEPSALYDGAPTYIYAAPMRDAHQNPRPIGVIALVFDAAPQFKAILQDAIQPPDGKTLAYFLDEHGSIISSNTDQFIENRQLNFALQWPKAFVPEAHWGATLIKDGTLYAIGCSHSGHYREYNGPQDRYRNNVRSVYLSPMGQYRPVAKGTDIGIRFESLNKKGAHADAFEVATFRIGSHWLGLPSCLVVEAFQSPHIIRLPLAPRHVAGTVMHKGETVTIINLGELTGQQKLDCKVADAQCVLLHDAVADARVALLVDELGEIPNIPPACFIESNRVMTGQTLIKAYVQADNNILFLLNEEQLSMALKNAMAPSHEKSPFEEGALDTQPMTELNDQRSPSGLTLRVSEPTNS